MLFWVGPSWDFVGRCLFASPYDHTTPKKKYEFQQSSPSSLFHKIVLQNSEASNTNSFFGTGRHKKKKANRLVTLSFSRNPSKSQFFFWEASGWMNRNLLASFLFPPPLFGRSGNPFYGSVKSPPPRGVLDLGLLPPETHDHSFPTSDERRRRKLATVLSGN